MTIRVWPHDLDLWGHMNGGRFLTLSDLGRLDLFLRSGLMTLVRHNRWVVPLGDAKIRFRRSLHLFDTCEMRTRLLGWDAKWAFMETRFVREGDTVATVVIRGLVRGREGNIAPERLFEMLGIEPPSLLIDERVRSWVEPVSVAGRAGRSESARRGSPDLR